MRHAILLYILLAPSVELILRFLTFHFDSLTLSSCRVSAGGCALLAFALHHRPAAVSEIVRSRQLFGMTLLLGALTAATAVAHIEGMARTNAATASLLGLLGVPLSIGLAMAVFGDERALLRRPGFLTGAGISLASAAALAAASCATETDLGYASGLLLLALAALAGATSGLLQKCLAARSAPIAIAGISACSAGAMLMTCTILQGRIGNVACAPPHVIALLLGSGVYGLVIGMVLGLALIRDIGLARYRLINLSVPVAVGICAYAIFGETLSLAQIACGTLVLFGAWLSVKSPRARSPLAGERGALKAIARAAA